MPEIGLEDTEMKKKKKKKNQTFCLSSSYG